ncbi:MAG: hypothetical protein CMJ18_20355 [Phycisphaeraceae bacterium]|nr:hypothetical protein [Phycisphaeraceae bacterium]
MGGLIGEILDVVATHPALRGRTLIIVTTDHGANLYAQNAAWRSDPGTGRPPYGVALPPIRNGDAANLATAFLGLPPVPGSTINARQELKIECLRLPPD